MIEMIEHCAEEDRHDFVTDILIRYRNLKKIYGYKIKNYWSNISTVDAYYRTNMDFLKPEVRNYFFRQEPEIYSKVSDLPPAKYNPGAVVKTVSWQVEVLSMVRWKILYYLKRHLSV